MRQRRRSRAHQIGVQNGGAGADDRQVEPPVTLLDDLAHVAVVEVIPGTSTASKIRDWLSRKPEQDSARNFGGGIFSVVEGFRTRIGRLFHFPFRWRLNLRSTGLRPSRHEFIGGDK